MNNDNTRLHAVKEAYWSHSDFKGSDIGVFKDALLHIKGPVPATAEQQKVLFFMLPDSIIGPGIAYGFGDTEVRESVHEFVEQNTHALTAAMYPGNA
ncbi:MAG: hypothetical protein Q7U16_12230 [Agitococcus sp.]|nr:hypothetical protein [Agitococcus sp.]